MPTIRVLPPGSVSNFSRNSKGKAYGLNGDLGHKFPLISAGVEVIDSSAEAVSCALSGVDEPLALVPLYVGMIGPKSIIQIEPLWTHTNSATAKVLKVKIGGTVIYSQSRTTTVREAPLIVLANRNSLTAQIQPYGPAEPAHVQANLNLPLTYSIDFSINNMLEITGNRASSSDALKLEYFRVLHFIGGN